MTITNTWKSALIALLFVFGLSVGQVRAGQLAKPRIQAALVYMTGGPMLFHFYLKNLNAQYSLGTVYWIVRIYWMRNNAMVFHTQGETEVKQSEEVKVEPTPTYTPTEGGDYKIVVEANSEANISGVQKDSVVVSVIEPSCEAPVQRSPGGMIVLTKGNTITYTAPQGCCYVITPFINTGVWYTLTPSSVQTISDGQSVTFTLTAKDPKPNASVVAFDWRECSKGKPRGKDYITVAPYVPDYDSSFTGPTAYPGLFISVFGDPVSTSTGRFVYQPPTDFTFASSPLLHFTRRYDGGLMDGGFAPGAGLNWQHNYNSMLIDQGTRVYVQMDDGRRLAFDKVGSTYMLRNTGMAGDLRNQGGVWQYTDVTRNLQYSFNSDGRLIKVDDGRTPVTITWVDGNIATASDALGHQIIFTADTMGRITNITDGERSVSLTYDAKGQATGKSSTDGRIESYGYSSSVPGELTTIIDAAGKVLVSNQYNAEGKVVQQIDSEGNLWTYDYSSGKAVLTDPDGVKEEHNLNGYGRVTALGPAGNQVTFAFDANGYLSTTTNAEGGATTYTHHVSGKPATMVTADGTTTYEYKQRTWNGATVYDLVKVTYPDMSFMTMTVDTAGRITEFGSSVDGRWKVSWNALGKVASISDPVNRVTTYEYDVKGHLTKITNPSGVTTSYTTNARGEITSVTEPGNAKQSYERDLLDRCTRYSNELGHMWNMAYAPTGGPASVTDALGGRTEFSYRADGLLTSVEDPSGATTTIEYTDAGRVRTIHDPMNAAMQFGYNDAGRPQTITDRAGNTTHIETDRDGNVTSVQSPEGRITRYEYDNHGRITSIETAGALRNTVQYDNRGRPSRMSDPNGRTGNYTYDALGNVTKLSFSPEVGSEYTYNAAGNLITLKDGAGGLWQWTYDAGGRCTSVKDPTGRTTSYTYDSRDRVATTTLPGSLGSCTYTYDAANHLTGIRYSDGTNIRYSYDANGRITGTNNDTCAYDADGNMVMSNGITMKYNANGWLTELTFAPGKTLTYMYNPVGNISNISDWNGGSISYTHDDDGLLTGIQRSNGVTTAYTRNDAGQVTRIADGSVATINLGYGTGSRITSVTRTGHLEPAPVKETVTATCDAGSVHLNSAPDTAGRATNVEGSTMTWNSASQLVQANGALNGTVTYDGFGRPIATTILTGASIVWNDAFGEGLPAVVRNQYTMYIVPTPGGTVAYAIDSASGDRFFPHFDHQGNTVLLTNDNGDVVCRISYAPYGEILQFDGTPRLPLLFGGMAGVIAISTKLFATPGRIYHAPSGRFLSPDPERSTHPQRVNPFQYAMCDPVNWNDWTGRSPQRTSSRADEIVDASNRRLEEAMRKTQEEYEARVRANEERAARRRAEREAAEKSRRDDLERIERERQEEEEELRRDREAFDRARAKAASLNETYNPPPSPPTSPNPAPGTFGGGSTQPGATPGSGGNTPGAGGQTPGSGGTRLRGGNGGSGNSEGSGSQGGNRGRRGSNGGKTSKPSDSQPLGPNGTGRGNYNPAVKKGTSVVGAFISGWIEGMSPSEIWDYYFGD